MGAYGTFPTARAPFGSGEYNYSPASSTFKAQYLQCNRDLSTMLKNVASQVIGAQLVNASDGSVFTGAVTVKVTGDGGTQATGSVGSGACTHKGSGYHTYAPAQAETNYDLVAFTFAGTGAVPVTVQVYTMPTTGLLAPTTLGRTLDVTSGGCAGVDWANVESPTTTIGLSGTTVKNATDVNTLATEIKKNAFIATELAIATVTSQTVFILTGGPGVDIANVLAIFFDASASEAPVVAEGSYVGSTGTLTLTTSTAITVTTSDHVTLLAVAASSSNVNVTSIATDAISAAAVSAAAVSKIQTGLATPTNITAATGVVLSGVTHTGAVIPTVTNLTNAPTSGDLTATMKSSVTTAATSATPTIAAMSTDAISAAAVSAAAVTKMQAGLKRLGVSVRHTLDATGGTPGTPGAYDETTETEA